MVLNPFERTILDVLKRSKRSLSTREVAQFSGMSWSTANKYLNRLNRKRKTLKTKKEGNKRMWKF